MTQSTCSIDGCERPVNARGWCVTHYGRWRRQGTPFLDVRPDRTCTIDDCSEPAKTRDWCAGHYQRWKKHGDPQAHIPLRPRRRNATADTPDKACSVDGCEKSIQGRGWCGMHYMRWKQRGDPLATGRHREACSVEGCDRKHASRGFCDLHWRRWKEHGDPLVTLHGQNIGLECSVDGCENQAEKRGWCAMHYARWKAHGDPSVTKMDRTPSPDGLCVVCHERPAGEDPTYARYCSGRCAMRAQRARKPKPPPEILTCRDCGQQFERPSRLGDPPQRCEPCREAHRKAWNAEWFQRLPPERLKQLNAQAIEWARRNPERGRAREQRRRAQKLKLPYEEFTDLEIFERDNWICGLCNESVDCDLRWPDPQSPSLDHILPLDCDGHHIRVNCQLAHLRCNIRKGNRISA